MKEPLAPEAATQSPYQVRFDWGLAGLRSIAQQAEVIAVVDALTFTTTLVCAVGCGFDVVPCEDPRDKAGVAQRSGALVAGERGDPGLTLSPASFTPDNVAAAREAWETRPQAGADAGGRPRLVVASRNGSPLAAAAASFGVPVVALSPGNAAAVAQWLIRRQEERAARQRVAVVAAGEVRRDGTLRFAAEDLLTAGAFVAACSAVGLDHSSPEAAAAGAAYEGLTRGLRHLLIASVTGQQLVAGGEKADIALALAESPVVPVLHDGIFTAAGAFVAR
ncbi:MAG TPA: 2-phosphosulfolactate phosphatase [Microbacteriaceae bacterium]|nr:2-phosphosulfolactate phosphatase [Microbacteriaceae bacterium]